MARKTVIKEKLRHPKNQAVAWKASDDLQVELISAHYADQKFSKHTHDTYSIGIVTEGAALCWVSGSLVRVEAGELVLVNPGEVHMGENVAGVPWGYRSFLISADAMRQAAEACHRELFPYYPASHANPAARELLLRTHHASEAGDSLEAQTCLRLGLMRLVLGSSSRKGGVQKISRQKEVVQLVEEYVQEHYRENIGLPDLAYAACMSQFHLVRVFGRATGLTPHQYVTQVRVERAKSMIQRGIPLLRVATECGFVDQSHMTKWFKRILGYTPGAYVPSA